MNSYESKINDYLKTTGIEANHLLFEQSCHSVKEAAEAVNEHETVFVKNICMMDHDNRFIVAIVKGEDRASTKRVGKALEIEAPRLATDSEVLERTGFPPGGVPSFGYDAVFLIDPKVTDMDYIYTGGGSENSLVRIQVKDLLEVNKGTVVRVRK
ncbi:aminoacyl-tRNA deacylase [Bacillus salitolerans]|uniref:Aminoacyl-tRNA deacylase n=1 Tax=Bacillus salitolerans TaxID=1437434 RepID=A0ABW4LWP4_9BACI